MHAFLGLVRRDIALALRQGAASGMTVAFFLVTVALFPLGVGPALDVLARIGAGVLWVAALLAAVLSLDRLFQADYEDGSLEQLALLPSSLTLTVLAKCLAHWATTGLPLMVAAPVLALLLNLEARLLGLILFAMFEGTLALSLLGAVGAALTVGVRRGGVLLSLLVLPLFVPVLVFGVAAIEAGSAGLSATPHLMLLGAFTLASLVLGPWAAAAAIRLALG